MTPRSIAIARTSGEPAPSTNIPPAVPIGLPPCGPRLGGARGPARRPRSTPLVPAPVGTALLPGIPVPLGSQDSDHTVVFRNKCELVVELMREPGGITGGRRLGSLTGPTPSEASSGPSSSPSRAPPHGFPTRLQPDARLYACRYPGVGPTRNGATGCQPPVRGAVVGTVAGGRRLHLSSAAACPLEGTGVPVVGRRCGSTGQGGGRQGRGLPPAVSPGQFGDRVDRRGDRGRVCGAIPPGGRVPGPQAAAGLGRVPGLNPGSRGADQPGPCGDAEPAAVGSVPVGGRRLHGLVNSPALESEEGQAQCAGRGAAAATAWLGDPEPAGEMAGRRGGSGPGTGGGSGLGAGRGPVAGQLGPEIRPLPSGWGEMRGRQPEEPELDIIT